MTENQNSHAQARSLRSAAEIREIRFGCYYVINGGAKEKKKKNC